MLSLVAISKIDFPYKVVQQKGVALYMGKMMLSGRMDEVYNMIFSNDKHSGEVI